MKHLAQLVLVAALPVFAQEAPVTLTVVPAQPPVQTAAEAQPAPLVVPLDPGAPLPEIPFPDAKPPVFDAKEHTSLAIADDWRNAPVLPAPGQGGRVVFVFGADHPTVVCQPKQVTDIELEPGESVQTNGLHFGDTVRWSIVPAVSGPASAPTTHLIVKPIAPGLSTSLVCATDRRMYHIRLVSAEADWTPFVSFTYPENERAQWAIYQEQQRKAREAATLRNAAGPGTTAQIGELDFEYKIEGVAPWKPVRVYNDGLKTVVQMPQAMQQTEAPALLVVGTDKKEQLVNYRLHGDRFIVDQIFAKAVLIAGVGKGQTRITITRLRPASTN